MFEFMSSRKSTEDKIRDKIRSHEFELSELAWQQMEALLDQNRTAKPGARSDRSRPAGAAWFWRQRHLLPVLLAFAGAALIFSFTALPTGLQTSAGSPLHPGRPATEGPANTLPEYPAETSSAMPPTIEKPATPSILEQHGLEIYPPAKRPLENKPAGIDRSIDQPQATAHPANSSPGDQTTPPLETVTAEPPVVATAGSALAFLPGRSTNPASDSLPQPEGIGLPLPPAWKADRFSYGISAGMGLTAVDYNSLRLSAAPHMGLFFAYRLSEKGSLQLEAQTKLVQNYMLSANFENSVLLPFGPAANQTTLETHSLQFYEFPLLWKQGLKGGRTALLAGVRPSLIRIYGYRSDAEVSSLADQLPTSNRDGIARFDLGLALGFEYRLSNHWLLDLRYTQGLTDLTFDNWFDEEAMHLNSDLQVSFRYVF